MGGECTCDGFNQSDLFRLSLKRQCCQPTVFGWKKLGRIKLACDLICHSFQLARLQPLAQSRWGFDPPQILLQHLAF